MMKRIPVLLALLFIPLCLHASVVAPEFRGIEFGYGAYDVLLAGDIHLFHWDFLSYKPFLRFDPFSIVLKWGVQFEYYPLTQFQTGFWIFTEDKVNPFVYTGFGLPINFASLYFPVGIGLQIGLANNFALNIKVYDNFVVTPISEDFPGWDVSISIKW